VLPSDLGKIEESTVRENKQEVVVVLWIRYFFLVSGKKESSCVGAYCSCAPKSSFCSRAAAS
jgi:hypothetical protein